MDMQTKKIHFELNEPGDYYGFAITYTVRVDIRDEDGVNTQHC